MKSRYSIEEILEAMNERCWKEGIDYELQDLLIWVERHDNKPLDDILDEFEDEPCY